MCRKKRTMNRLIRITRWNVEFGWVGNVSVVVASCRGGSSTTLRTLTRVEYHLMYSSYVRQLLCIADHVLVHVFVVGPRNMTHLNSHNKYTSKYLLTMCSGASDPRAAGSNWLIQFSVGPCVLLNSL